MQEIARLICKLYLASKSCWMAFIEIELLISRVQYLEEVNSRPGKIPVDKSVSVKVKEMIRSGELISFMQVEAVFNFLAEKTAEACSFGCHNRRQERSLCL